MKFKKLNISGPLLGNGSLLILPHFKHSCSMLRYDEAWLKLSQGDIEDNHEVRRNFILFSYWVM
jgi:hypothetical protein